jgi:DNA-binding transcriptional regulator YdaS (Cro superfamily)
MSLSQIIGTLGSQSEAARRIGVSQPAVNSWVHGRATPTPLAVRAIAAALGRTVEDIQSIIAADRATREARPGIPIDTPEQTRSVLAEYSPTAGPAVRPGTEGAGAVGHAGDPAEAGA